MKRKDDEEIMGQAIQKASKLINLLQKDNQELQNRIKQLQIQLTQGNKKHQQLKSQYNQLSHRVSQLSQSVADAKADCQARTTSLTAREEQLAKKTANIKELHNKVGVISAQLKETTQLLNQRSKKLLSLQNQNEYLIDKINAKEKQNQGQKQQRSELKDSRNQLNETRKIKQAFARRCQQLKAENAILVEKAAEYKQKSIDVVNRNLQTASLTAIIRDQLGVTPEVDSQKQLEQLSLFLGYRLGHIERMCQNILAQLNSHEKHTVSNLKDLQFVCQRMASYVDSLLSQQQLKNK